MCIYTLKEYIEYYKNRGTTVFVTFLDASKAFDRLKYWLLFDKLVKKCVPLFIIKLLCFWYTHKKMVVRWGTTISTQFTVANGVKQGGIIFPILVNMYIDDLSIALNNSGIEGYLGDAFLYHLCYADDICLISLSSSRMQQLLTYVRTMLLIINYFIMVLNHFLCVSKRTPLKLNNHLFILLI